MRIPFMAGWFDGTRNRTRVLVAEGRTPRVFPGPWRLEAVVREEDAGGVEGETAPSNHPEPRRSTDLRHSTGPGRPTER